MSKSQNPWVCESLLSVGLNCEMCAAEDRIDEIKSSTDIRWLRQVLAWRDNQIIVRRHNQRQQLNSGVAVCPPVVTDILHAVNASA